MLAFSSPGHPAWLYFKCQSNQRNLCVYLSLPFSDLLTYLRCIMSGFDMAGPSLSGSAEVFCSLYSGSLHSQQSQTVPVWRIPRVQLVHGAVWPLCRGGRGDLISFPEIFMKNRRLQIFHISTGAGYFSCHSSVISAGLLYEMWLMLKHYSIFWMGCRLVALQTCAHTVLNLALSFFIVFSAEQHVGLLPVSEQLLRG